MRSGNHSPDLREKLKERLAKLSSGVGVIRVGAATETEMKEPAPAAPAQPGAGMDY